MGGGGGMKVVEEGDYIPIARSTETTWLIRDGEKGVWR